jgi:hypothetical protein
MKKMIALAVLIVLYTIGSLDLASNGSKASSTSYNGVSTENQLAVNACYERTKEYATCYAGWSGK